MSHIWKQTVLVATAIVVIVGIIIAFANLPVRTGCAFYGKCPDFAGPVGNGEFGEF